MPTTTPRLDLPVPVNSDPANVPGYMLGLADALDGGANSNYEGVAVFAGPGSLGQVPADPIVGTLYPVSGSPPYLLYYTGESTAGTGTAPTGYRLIGQAGTNLANITNTSPGNSAIVGVMPVWAPLDHQHFSYPWSNNQTTALYGNATPSDGTDNAFARANHSHGSFPLPVTGFLVNTYQITNQYETFLTTGTLEVGTWTITFTGLVDISPTSGEGSVIIGIAEDTATAEFYGPTSCQLVSTTNASDIGASISFTCIAQVTTEGGVPPALISSDLIGIGNGTVTGYVATWAPS